MTETSSSSGTLVLNHPLIYMSILLYISTGTYGDSARYNHLTVNCRRNSMWILYITRRNPNWIPYVSVTQRNSDPINLHIYIQILVLHIMSHWTMYALYRLMIHPRWIGINSLVLITVLTILNHIKLKTYLSYQRYSISLFLQFTSDLITRVVYLGGYVTHYRVDLSD